MTTATLTASAFTFADAVPALPGFGRLSTRVLNAVAGVALAAVPFAAIAYTFVAF